LGPEQIANATKDWVWYLGRRKYNWRHLIKNLFAKLKQFRAIDSRFDKHACAFLGFIHLAAVIWFN